MPQIGYSYSTDNVEVPVKDDSATTALSRGVISAGVDAGGVTRFLRTDADGKVEFSSSITIGTVNQGLPNTPANAWPVSVLPPSSEYRILSAYLKDSLGSPDMNVNGSVTPEVFETAAVPTLRKWVQGLRIILQSTNVDFSNSADLRRFGSIATPLTNGILIESVQSGITAEITLDPIKQIGNFYDWSDETVNVVKAVSASIDLLRVDFIFSQPLVIDAGSSDTFRVVIRDNLTSIHSLRGAIRGYQQTV